MLRSFGLVRPPTSLQHHAPPPRPLLAPACRPAPPSWQHHQDVEASSTTTRAAAKQEATSSSGSSAGDPKQGSYKVSVAPQFVEGAAYLKSIGLANPADIARILDVAMSPGSLFADYRSGKRATNASARLLDVKEDMEPVVNFMLSKGVSKADVLKIITGHPPVLSYGPARLEAFWQYMLTLGVQDASICQAIVARPSLLGLEVDKNLEKIVDYLKYIETPPDQIIKHVLQTI